MTAKTIHQFVHTLSYGDAISGEVLALQRSLNESGISGEIFALNVHPKFVGKAKKISEFHESRDSEVILHYSLGSPLNDIYLKLHQSARALIFHNLTPPEWFKGVNPRIVSDIEAGLKELPQLCRVSDQLIADSKFNAAELKKLGFDASVLELPFDPHRWAEPANPGFAALVRNEPGIHVLHVGRIAPNKCIEDVIKTFYFLHHFVAKKSRLWIVGIDIDTELYSFAVKRIVHELGLNEAVNFVGCRDDSEVRALYENCSVYLCMSEHEGFCLPLVEAMNFGLPIIAYDSSAVPDTLGGAGILCREKRHAELAELIKLVHEQPELRSRLIAAGKKRTEELSYPNFTAQVKKLFLESDPIRKPLIASC